MTRKRTTRLVCLLLATTVALGLTTVPAAAKTTKPAAKNVIVMIADGFGVNHNTAGSFYEYGKDSRQIYNRFPFQFAMSTYMAYPEGDECDGAGYDPFAAWSDFEYVMSCATDSAAAATAMATGVKTEDGVIGQDADLADLPNVLEFAEELGKATGVVTSVEWTHATPAGFVAHNQSRNNYAGIGQEMVYNSAADVIMGAGHPWFGHDGQPLATPNTFKYVGGQTTWDDLVAGTAGGDADGDTVADPWLLVQTRAEFQSLASGPTPKRVLGTAQVYQTLQVSRSGDILADPYVVPLTPTVPTLEEMTAAALNILDDDPDGMFLMIEGGAVDWASHGNYNPNESGRMIEELIDFERSVEAVVDWVKANSNWGETLLIVTADHETGYLNGPGSDPSWEPIGNNGAGFLPGMEWYSVDHTNSLVMVAAKGDAGRMLRGYADGFDPVRGRYLDNTELGQLIFRAMG
ncbi:MAG: alkaline phosphatase [Acidimicrobiia bacterium]|nr:alkaline phosphatase [Acidimicrobiia bacterium]